MLDVANQFGDTGARSVVSTVMQTLKAGASEMDFLSAVGGETVARIARQFGAVSKEVRSTSNRREVMRTTPWLTDTPAVFT
jgi:Flp pilus assembly protein TadB